MYNLLKALLSRYLNPTRPFGAQVYVLQQRHNRLAFIEPLCLYDDDDDDDGEDLHSLETHSHQESKLW